MISEELYDAIEEMRYDGETPIDLSNQWIHLEDAVDKGSISSMEAYNAISLGYVPKHLKVRYSRHSHLL